ncbi:MAG: hypothetical protein R3C12_24575 [Planctomycetaceae bacterium]
MICTVAVLTGSGRILVHASESARVISFRNDITPILTKAGCNAGSCHAKAGGGQNGFQLSVLGYEPREDYESIVLEGRGRRLFPAAAEQSLLLTKGRVKFPMAEASVFLKVQRTTNS